MRRSAAYMALWIWSTLVPVLAMAQTHPPRIDGIQPDREGELVVCHLKTSGLPAAKQLQTMRSGLVSSVELDLALLDENDNLLGGNSLTLRLAFDLWEEVFSVRESGKERRFKSLDDLESYLNNLSHLPVIPAADLVPNQRYRLRVGLAVNSIAPDEQERVEGVIAGDNRPRREGQDRQEASVSIGRLIRLFYKDRNDEQGDNERHSRWFDLKELSHETD